MNPRSDVRHRRRATRPVVGVSHYHTGARYARVLRAVKTLLARGKVVAPVDVLVEMGLLDPAQLHQWRLGHVPYVEKVIHGSLTRLSQLLRILRFHAHDLNLVPSSTAYMRWGKGPAQALRNAPQCFVLSLAPSYSPSWPGDSRSLLRGVQSLASHAPIPERSWTPGRITAAFYHVTPWRAPRSCAGSSPRCSPAKAPRSWWAPGGG